MACCHISKMLPTTTHYGQIVRAHFHVFVAFHNIRLGIHCHLAQVTGVSMAEQEAGFLLKGQCKYRRVVTSTCQSGRLPTILVPRWVWEETHQNSGQTYF
jgi:hypothetical protein